MALDIACSDYDRYVGNLETNGYPVTGGRHSGEELKITINKNGI